MLIYFLLKAVAFKLPEVSVHEGSWEIEAAVLWNPSFSVCPIEPIG